MKRVPIAAISACILFMTSHLASSLPTVVDVKQNNIVDNDDAQQTQQIKQRNNRPQGCPAHFSYLPSVRGCYKVVTDLLTWTNAALRCKALNSNAHLLIVNNAAEQRSVVEDLVKWHSASCDWGMWTAGQRTNPGTPYSDFVWKIVDGYNCPRMFEMTYAHWLSGQPNSNPTGVESCMHLFRQYGYLWNDQHCMTAMCSVCEIDM